MELPGDNLGLGLTSEQTEKILQFQDLTGIDDMTICRDVLQRHQWDIEVAVQEQLNIREGRPSVYATESRPPVVVNDHAATHYYTPSYDGAGNGFRGFISYLFNFVWSFCYNTFAMIFQLGFRLIRPDPRRFITDPVADVTHFINNYEEKFGNIHPVFYQGTYAQALNDAKHELRFLLVYLHKEESTEAIVFCRNTLSNSEVVTYINHNMLFWACSINTGEGYRVSQSLRESHFPFLALIVLKDNRMTVVGRIEGPNQPRVFLQRLQSIIRENEINLIQARADRYERSLTQTLRAQQDEAYMESLRADQEKERRREEERQAVLAEQRKREQEIEEEEQRKQNIARMKIECVTKIPPEPDQINPDAVHIVFKLPCGARLDRRFLLDHSLEAVYYYVFCHPNSPDSFEITTNFPKRTLQCRPNDGELIRTLRQAGLKNREVLFVNDLDA